jgi:N-acetylmuramoyl-L-alanine amidase
VYNGVHIRMMLKTLTLVPWMVLAGAAYGQVRSADVLYTFRETTPSPAYRVGDECFIAVETAEMWGWKITPDGGQVDINAEGHKIEIPTRTVEDRTTFPLRKAISELGGQTDWTSGTDTLNVYSVLTQINAQSGPKLHAAAPLSFKAFPFYLNPGRTVVDLDGVRIGPGTKQDLGPGARMFQYRTNVVRVLLDTSFVPKLPSGLPETNTLDLEVPPDPDQPAPAVQNATAPTVVPPIPTNSSTEPGVPLTVTVDSDSPRSTTLGFHLSNFQSDPTVQTPDPDTVQITLPGVTTSVAAGFKAATEAVESVDTKPGSNGTIITIKLARPMGVEVSSASSGITLTLLKPNVGDGRLAGKIIVVDPGHGGHDRGAHFGSLNEKDLTLEIGRQLGVKFAEAGATVIMTRRTDVFIPLMTRSDISNENHANFFISCHINSTGGEGSQSGTITFHHLGNQIGYLLARCIQSEIAKVNHLPNLGAWSDGKIYGSGFSVLRHTDAPAVLIEMGFINHPRDRARIITADFQDSVTSAVVRGVRVFLGETKANE